MWNKNGSSKKNNIMKRKLRINGHSHLLPYPEQIPSFMKEKEIFWVDDERKHMLQKGWRRPVTDSSFFLDEKLAWMERLKPFSVVWQRIAIRRDEKSIAFSK